MASFDEDVDVAEHEEEHNDEVDDLEVVGGAGQQRRHFLWYKCSGTMGRSTSSYDPKARERARQHPSHR